MDSTGDSHHLTLFGRERTRVSSVDWDAIAHDCTVVFGTAAGVPSTLVAETMRDKVRP